MFQFNRDFCDDFCALRDVALSRSLNPALQTFEAWLSANAAGSRGVEAAGPRSLHPVPSGENAPERRTDAPSSSPFSVRRFLARLGLAAGLAAGPAPGSPAAPPPRAETPADRARRALAERDVPFEAHAFFGAAADGDLPLLDLFLDAGMPAATRDQWGNSALLEAARGDRPDVVERLLARGAKAGDAPGGEPPLTAAAESGSLGALKALLAGGADPDQPADPAKGPGGTPLQRACAAEAWEAARLLLEGGASPGSPRRRSRPPSSSPRRAVTRRPSRSSSRRERTRTPAAAGARPRSGCRSGTATSRRSGSFSSPGPT